MKKRLFLVNTLIICCALLVLFGASLYITYVDNIDLAKDTVINYTDIYSNFYKGNTNLDKYIESVNVLQDNVRITIISSSGKVLKDSSPLDTSTFENHLGREEIQAALKGTPEVVIRHSTTLNTDMMYYAKKVNISSGDYIFIRFAVPINSINSYFMRTLPLFILIIIVIIIASFFLIDKSIKKLLMPFEFIKQSLQSLNDGNYKKSDSNSKYEEINQITNEINDISEKLEKDIYKIKNEKNKLHYILNNINDGLFAVNSDLNVTLINDSAKRVFEITGDIKGHNLNYLTINHQIIDAVNACTKSGHSALFELEQNGLVYLVTVKKLDEYKADDIANLCIVILNDITEIAKNQKLREEFFANASHELKTPLTTIKGFNELMAINNKDENLNKFTGRISKETDRLLFLIGDMLKLSELENVKNISLEDVDLRKISEEIKESLSTLSSEKNISLDIDGKGTVKAEQNHIYELLKNLLENAVKYNVENGKVKVCLKEEKNTVSITVIDTGIGIPAKDQPRIFERFYRVEKSRSRESGGTGLGLSIVKHICKIYNAELVLKSKVGEGTEIKVIFKK